ncbi:Structural maintenance of chromosomes protein 2 [Arachnomyces sp. PD_36]|nr:Structural maintenance of chromosomes protein 2 [Arachnomyces sp. PD_36]
MPDNQQGEALLIIWIFPALTTILVACRLYSRHLGRNYGWDDGMIVVAYILTLAEVITAHQSTVLNYSGYRDSDIPDLTVEQQIAGKKWGFALQMVYHPLMGAIRASIVLFLFRIEDKRRPIRAALILVFWLNVGYSISTFIANLMTCSPVSYVYDAPATDRMVNGELVPGGKCFDSLRFILASCALSIFMDLIIMPIPTAMVWNLTMPKKTKIAVVLIMSMGWIATGVSVARFVVYYYRWQPDNEDRNYEIGYTISIAESNVAMWAACVPALKRLVRHLMPSCFSSYMSNDYQTTGAHWTSNHARITPRTVTHRTRNSKVSNPWRSKRDSSESGYHMNPLCLDSDSREQIMNQPLPPAHTTPTSRAWVNDDISDLDTKPKGPFG